MTRWPFASDDTPSAGLELGPQDQPGVDAQGGRAVAVAGLVVHEDRPIRGGAHTLQGGAVDPGVGLGHPRRHRQHQDVEHVGQAEVLHDRDRGVRAVADERGLRAARPQLRGDLQRVLVQGDAAVPQERPLVVRQLPDQGGIGLHARGIYDRRHVAFVAAVRPDAPRRPGPVVGGVQRGAFDAQAIGDMIGELAPAAPHERVVQVEQHGPGHAGEGTARSFGQDPAGPLADHSSDMSGHRFACLSRAQAGGVRVERSSAVSARSTSQRWPSRTTATP